MGLKALIEWATKEQIRQMKEELAKDKEVQKQEDSKEHENDYL